MTVGELTADGRARVLADRNQMPILGLGVLRIPAGADCVISPGPDQNLIRTPSATSSGLTSIKASPQMRSK